MSSWADVRRPDYLFESGSADGERGRVEYLSPQKPSLPVRRAENLSFEGTRGFRSAQAYELALEDNSILRFHISFF